MKRLLSSDRGQVEVDVPEGRLHRLEVLARGWTTKLIDTHLSDVVKVEVPEVWGGLSNKTYALAEVTAAEDEVAAVRKTVGDAATRIPATPGVEYDATNCVSRTVLIRRGWIPRDVERLLGGPDHLEITDRRNPQHFFGLDRVEQAEATDAELVERLDQREDERQHRIAEAARTHQAIWRRHQGRWVAQGRDLIPGARITITRRHGDPADKVVDQILSTDADGITLATVRNPPATPAPAPVAKTPVPAPVAAPAATVAAPVPERVMVLTRSLPLHTPVRDGGVWIVCTSIRRHTISEDDPAIWGSHLLGSEGRIGYRVTYRLATADEIADHA